MEVKSEKRASKHDQLDGHTICSSKHGKLVKEMRERKKEKLCSDIKHTTRGMCFDGLCCA